MQQILFHLPQWLPLVGGMPIYGYGVMMVVGFFGALQLAKFLARRSGIDPEVFVNAGLIALVTGVIGARLSHVLENLGQYTDAAPQLRREPLGRGQHPQRRAHVLRRLSACDAVYDRVRADQKGARSGSGMDIVAPCLMIGLGFGRIGCLLNGCCYGAEADKASVPWAVRYDYGSNAYVEEYEKGKLPAPGRAEGDEPDGKVVLLQPQTVEKDPVLEEIAAEQHSEWLHPAQSTARSRRGSSRRCWWRTSRCRTCTGGCSR